MDYVIVVMSTLDVWAFYSTEEKAKAALEDARLYFTESALRCRRNHDLYGHRVENYWLNQADKYEKMAAECEVMSDMEFMAREAKQLQALPLKQITKEQWEEMLNILPPLSYGENFGVLGFFMSEFTRGRWTEQYAKIGDKYYSKLVNYSDRNTWITPEMVKEYLKGEAV